MHSVTLASPMAEENVPTGHDSTAAEPLRQKAPAVHGVSVT